MRRKRCTLCGGKLVNGICQECGLDNRKSDSRYQTRNGTPHWGNETREERFKFQKKRLGRKQSYRRQNLLRLSRQKRKLPGKKGQRYLRG